VIFRCVVCEEFSFSHICKKCKSLLKPEFIKKGDVVSFYRYEEIEFLVKFKYEKFGSFIFKELASSFSTFSKSYPEILNIIPIDDRIDKGYSHTAILANSMKKDNKLYSTLHSTSNVKYAGKSLQFRLQNPRNFKYKGPKNIDVVLVDDIVTTGTTLKEAKEVLKEHRVNVLFSLVLADLRDF